VSRSSDSVEEREMRIKISLYNLRLFFNGELPIEHTNNNNNNKAAASLFFYNLSRAKEWEKVFHFILFYYYFSPFVYNLARNKRDVQQ
jgi:hypothetical protein